jgi:hypothetical protein
MSEAGVVITATGTGASVRFAHAISANYAAIQFTPTDMTKNFEYVEVTLTDAVDPTYSVTFRAYKDTSMADNFRVQDEKGEFSLQRKILSSLAEAQRLQFYYDNDTFSIYNCNNLAVGAIKYTTDGRRFTGFASGAIYVEAKLGNSIAGASIAVYRLGNQSFDADILAEGDIIKPQLATRKSITDMEVAVGYALTVQKAFALDVLQAKSSVKVSLTAPDGTKLLNNMPCDEDRTLIMDKLGNYKLTYTLEDAVGNIDKQERILTAVDGDAPIIELVGQYKTRYRIGDTIKLLNVNVYDELTSDPANITLYVIVYPTDYLPEYLEAGDSYTFETEGYYKITYCAVDEAGNRGFATYNIYVE